MGMFVKIGDASLSEHLYIWKITPAVMYLRDCKVVLHHVFILQMYCMPMLLGET